MCVIAKLNRRQRVKQKGKIGANAKGNGYLNTHIPIGGGGGGGGGGGLQVTVIKLSFLNFATLADQEIAKSVITKNINRNHF